MSELEHPYAAEPSSEALSVPAPSSTGERPSAGAVEASVAASGAAVERLRSGLLSATRRVSPEASSHLDESAGEADIAADKARARERYEREIVPELDRLRGLADQLSADPETAKRIREIASRLSTQYARNEHILTLDGMLFEHIQELSKKVARYLEKGWQARIGEMMDNIERDNRAFDVFRFDTSDTVQSVNRRWRTTTRDFKEAVT